MYTFPHMIDLGLRDGKSWTSPDHRIVAINVCIANPNVHDMTTLQHNVFLINAIFQDQIRKVTFTDLSNLGVVF